MGFLEELNKKVAAKIATEGTNVVFNSYIEKEVAKKNIERTELVNKAIEVAMSLEGQIKSCNFDAPRNIGADGKPIGEPAYKPETFKRKTDSENKLKPIIETLTAIQMFSCSDADDVEVKANELDKLYKTLKEAVTKGSANQGKSDGAPKED